MYSAPLMNLRALPRAFWIAGRPGFVNHYKGITPNLQEYSALNCILNFDFFVSMHFSRSHLFIFRAFSAVFGGIMRIFIHLFLQWQFSTRNQMNLLFSKNSLAFPDWMKYTGRYDGIPDFRVESSEYRYGANPLTPH